MAKFDWEKNPEVSDKVKSMWEAGHSASEISNAVGLGISRNAIIGRIHRMDVAPRASITAPKFSPAKKASKPLPKPKPTPIEFIPPVLPPETHGDMKQCHFITGDPCQPGWQMCGVPVKEGYGYCAYHWSVIYDQEASKRARAR